MWPVPMTIFHILGLIMRHMRRRRKKLTLVAAGCPGKGVDLFSPAGR
jgi:hypothetical protein